MNTPAHIIFGAAAFAHPNKPKLTMAAIIGGLIPDLSLYLMVFWSYFVLGNNPDYIFNVQYYSLKWQSIFAIDNSFFVWAIILYFSILIQKNWLKAFASSAFLHLSLDFLLHSQDARRQLWPLSDWVFISPLSYWDKNHYGHVIGGLEILITLSLTIFLISKFGRSKLSFLFMIIALLEIVPTFIFSSM